MSLFVGCIAVPILCCVSHCIRTDLNLIWKIFQRLSSRLHALAFGRSFHNALGTTRVKKSYIRQVACFSSELSLTYCPFVCFLSFRAVPLRQCLCFSVFHLKEPVSVSSTSAPALALGPALLSADKRRPGECIK